jgi:hypothetical protein
MKLIVGIATTPKRVSCLEPTINSLARQSLGIDEVVVVYPRTFARFDYSAVPDNVVYFLNQMGVTLYQPEGDRGPAWKFLGAKEFASPEDAVIWCDDDVTYQRTWAEHLVSVYDKRWAAGQSGYNIVNDYDKPEYELVEGRGGVICCASNIPDKGNWPEISDTAYDQLSELQQDYFLSDDLVVSQLLRNSGTRVVAYPPTRLNFKHTISHNQNTAIHKTISLRKAYTNLITNQKLWKTKITTEEA